MGWMDENANRPDVRIDAGFFWPEITSGKFYELYRPPAELPHKTVLAYLQGAIVAVRKELRTWRAEQSVPTLADVDQETVGGIGEKVILWERAVYCEAKADILRETETADRRKDAENTAKSGRETEENYRRMAADAMALMADENRITVGSL